MEEIHIASCVVRVRADQLTETAIVVEQLPRCEVFASHADGKLVVVLEADDAQTITSLMDSLRDLPGVLSVALVYQHAEAAVAMRECMA